MYNNKNINMDYKLLDIEVYKRRPENCKFHNIYENFNYKDYPENFKCCGSFNEQFFNSIFEYLKPSIVIELGTYLGFSCIYMANLCKKYHENNYRIFAVDTWLGNWHYETMNWVHGYPTMYHSFVANLHYTGLEKNVYPVPLPTAVAVNNIRDSLNNLNLNADLIYIDAGHDFFSVYADCHNYFPLLRTGGMLIGDDFQSEGVSTAVKEFCNVNNLTYEVSGINWIIQK